MDVSFIRGVANVPASAVLFMIGLVVAWAVDQPEWAAVKAFVAGPFLALAASPFCLVMHLLASLAGILAIQVGLPGRVVAIIAAGVLAFAFASGSTDSSTFGDPTIANLAFVVALVVPWLFSRPALWPWRLDA
jgi:hypothetical protein